MSILASALTVVKHVLEPVADRITTILLRSGYSRYGFILQTCGSVGGTGQKVAVVCGGSVTVAVDVERSGLITITLEWWKRQLPSFDSVSDEDEDPVGRSNRIITR